MFRVVIPARFDSARLPGKVLLPIGGRPMLHWVCERARASGAEQVVVATDDERIRSCAAEAGIECVMTARSHPSGTDRIAEVARTLRWASADVVVNLQGDEPLMPPALVGQVARLLQDHADADIATLAAPVTSRLEFLDPNAVKVVLAAGTAGAPAVFRALHTPGTATARSTNPPGPYRVISHALRHISACTPTVCSRCCRLSQLPPWPHLMLRRAILAQLRALANGMQIRVAIAALRPGMDVNTPADLDRIRALLETTATG